MARKIKGGGTKKVCLPAAKVRSMSKEERRKVDPTTAEKLDAFMAQLTMYAAGVQFPFTFILRDPAGNSHIQNPAAPLEYKYLKLYIK